MSYNNGDIYDAAGHKIGEVRPRGELGIQGCLGILLIAFMVVGTCVVIIVDNVHRAMYDGADSPQAATATALTQQCAGLSTDTAEQIAKAWYDSAQIQAPNGSVFVMQRVTSINIDTTSATTLDNFGEGCDIQACLKYDYAYANNPDVAVGSDEHTYTFDYLTATHSWTVGGADWVNPC